MLLIRSKWLHLLFSLLFLSVNSSFAQKEIPAFGVFTPAEIALKECDFDKDAEAIVFIDQAKSYYNDEYNLVTEKRIRLKILKERGIERGNIHLKYYSDGDFESIFNIEAVVLSFDDQQNQVLSKLDRKSVYNKKINKYHSEISFALPNIKAGTIVEYKYMSQMKHYGGLHDWIFQQDIPVVLSSYNLTIVPNAEFAYTVYKSKLLPILIKPQSSNGSVLFEMNNIPGLRDEAYMGAARDYLQRIKFQFSGYKQVESTGYSSNSRTTKYSTTWKDLARELMNQSYFGNQLNKSLAGSEILQQEWLKEPDQLTKMKTIHDYVRSHFSWNQVYSKYADDGVKGAWEKKTGTTGEINLILINLLKEAGLAVSPLLVSERDFGKIDTTYPYVDQFDKVVAYVTIGTNHYVLDGTDRQTPSIIIPFKLLNTTAFVVDRKNAFLIKIRDDGKKNFNLVNLIGNINNTGTVELDASVNNYNYAKIEKKQKFISDKKKYEKEFFEPFNLTSLDTFTVDGLEVDSLPIHHNAKLSYGLSKTGNYFLLNYNLFTGLNKNPFITDQRFTDIDFGCMNSYVLSSSFNLPSGLATQSLPKSVKLVLPDQSMFAIRQVQQIENTIQISLRIEFSKTQYSANDYAEVQGFYKQMLELLNEPVVLKAKS